MDKIITITAGHGGNDPGAVAHGVNERELMTELRDLVAMKVREAGCTARTDGARWTNLPLAAALLLVPGSQTAIELHCNAHENTAATGVEVVASPYDKVKAQRIARAISDVLGLRLRGERGWVDQTVSPRGKLGFVRAGGLVVETFFISNKADLAAYQAKKWLVASAIARELTS